jgi:cell shape-determining protein MreC
MDKDKLKIFSLQKEVRELKEENKNLNWMLTKQFEHSFKQIKENKTK